MTAEQEQFMARITRERSAAPAMYDLLRRLVEAVQYATAGAPTGLDEVRQEDCRACAGRGTVNVGTPVDPEPGPCLACGCEVHREPHPDCMTAPRDALPRVSALLAAIDGAPAPADLEA